MNSIFVHEILKVLKCIGVFNSIFYTAMESLDEKEVASNRPPLEFELVSFLATLVMLLLFYTAVNCKVRYCAETATNDLACAYCRLLICN